MASQGKHRVQNGETLDGIAKKFGLPGHEPIWRFNSQVLQKPISNDPNKIAAGVEITIPLTLAQYEIAITRLRELKRYSDKDFNAIENALNEDKAEMDRFGKRIDLAADVIFAVKGIGKAVLTYGSRYATLIVGKETLKLVPKVADAINPNSDSAEGQIAKRAGNVVAENSLLPLAGRAPKPGLVGKSLLKEGADAAVENLTRKAVEANKLADWQSEAIKMISKIAMNGVKGLEAISPSGVAKLAIGLRYGQTPDEVHREAINNIRQSRDAARRSVESSIARLLSERQTVYAK